MRSPLDALQTPAPVNLRRLAGEFHSVAKQASFSIAFWSNFGGFGKPKSMPKFALRVFFSDVDFEPKFTSNFAPILGARNRKNYKFLLEKQ